MGAKDLRLGGWDDDREELASMPVEGVGLYTALPEFVDFKSTALRLLSKVSDVCALRNMGPAYFVLADSELFSRVRTMAASVPLLRSTEGKEFFGKIWFVPRNLGHGFAVDTSSLSPVEVYKYVEDLGGGSRPAIVVPADEPFEATIYPLGISQPEECELIDLNATVVSAESIDRALDGLYGIIRSPDQSAERPLWEDSDKWWPVKNAERAVQHEVTRALAGYFGWMVDVRSEQPSSIGRTDVELIQFRGLPVGHNIRHALVELKVLRSFTNAGKTISPKLMVRHIAQGVRQAAEYGEAANSNIRMLCCYDMRKDDLGTPVVFSNFFKPAADRNVLLRRYYLYGSSKALREALDDQKVAAGAKALPG